MVGNKTFKGEYLVQEVPSMPMRPLASRLSAAEVLSVVLDGVRHEQDRYDDRAGDQRGGYLAVIDAATGQRLWRVKVHTLAPSRPAAGTDHVLPLRAPVAGWQGARHRERARRHVPGRPGDARIGADRRAAGWVTRLRIDQSASGAHRAILPAHQAMTKPYPVYWE